MAGYMTLKKVNIDGKDFVSLDDLLDVMVETCVGYESLEDGNECIMTDFRDEIMAFENMFRYTMNEPELHFEFKRRYLKKRYGALLPRRGS